MVLQCQKRVGAIIINNKVVTYTGLWRWLIEHDTPRSVIEKMKQGYVLTYTTKRNQRCLIKRLKADTQIGSHNSLP